VSVATVRAHARAVVIGSGLGGLGAAIRLQAGGLQVTLMESRDQLGGRASQLQQDGYTFDLGPTIITAPHLLETLWGTAGRNVHDDVDLIPLQPYYQIRFRGDTTRFDYGPKPLDATVETSGDRANPGRYGICTPPEAEVARISPSDLPGYRRFLVDTEQIYVRAFEQLGRRPFLSWRDIAKVAPELVRLGAHRDVYSFVSGYVRDPRLRCILSFHPLFLGGSPFRASAIYSIVPYLEQQGGVWFAKGGMHALVQAMGRLFTDLGGIIRHNAPVAAIVAERGHTAGVRLVSGELLPAETVVSNADVNTTYNKLVPPEYRGRLTGRRMDDFRYSMSCFLLYLGLDREYPHLRHHTILMPQDYRGVVNAIFSGRLLEDDLAVYLHAPTRTDPTLAPPGCESVYALVPVPNLAGNVRWPDASDRIRNRTMQILADDFGMDDIEQHIRVEHRITPLHFRDALASHLGAAFSIEPTLLQSAYFRPHNQSERLPGLYIVGAGTHPGAGLPGVLLSAEITADLILGHVPSPRPLATA
jgi:phytoene desaturase